jgi:hypothetical protein
MCSGLWHRVFAEVNTDDSKAGAAPNFRVESNVRSEVLRVLMTRYSGMQCHIVWMKFVDHLCQGFGLIYRMILNTQAVCSSEIQEISTEPIRKFA